MLMWGEDLMAIDSNKVNNASTAPQSNNMISNRQFGSHSNFSMPNRPESLNEGQILHGEITDLRNNEVTFTLTDNTTIIGHISDSSNLYIGQTTSFRITDISAKQISLECLVNSFSNRQNITILKALEEAGMEKTERNMQLVQDLLQYGMPINKQMLQQMTKQLALVKGTSISTLVIMNKYNMPVSPEMAKQFECYRTGDHSLLQGIDKVSEEIPSLLEALSENASSDDVANFGNSLMSVVTHHIESSVQPNLSLNASVLTAPERNELINFINNTNENNPEVFTEKHSSTDSSTDLTTITASIADGSASINEITDLLHIINDDNPEIKLISDKLNTAEEYLRINNHEISQIMDKEELSDFSRQLKELRVPEEILSDIEKGQISTEQVFSAIHSAIELTPSQNSSDVSNLFSSNSFQKLFKHVIKNIWTLSPRDLKQNDKIQDYYRKLVDDLHATTSLIENNLSGADSEVLTRQTTNLNDNIQFMQQLNQMFSFLQLPLRLHDQTIHSDLYVYTKKDELKHHPEKISVLLHLDLNNIGPLDIHITKNRSNVNANFFCPDKFSCNLIENNIELLSNSLNEYGYSFKGEVTNASKKTDIVEEFISQNTEGTSSAKSNITRYAFDIRA